MAAELERMRKPRGIELEWEVKRVGKPLDWAARFGQSLAMVEIADIKDRDSLEAWLNTQPHKTSVAIAQRAAMRVLPLYWQWELKSAPSRNDDLKALPVLRRLLISGVAANCPTLVILDAICDAADAANTVAAPTAPTEFNAAVAAHALAFAVAHTSAAYNPASHAAASAVGADTWNILRTDCAELVRQGALAGVKLWPNGENPYVEKWQQIKSALSKDSVDWSFWVKWYEAALAGVPLEWEMLKQIALIPPKDWEQGPTRVNGLIAEIEEEFEGGAAETDRPSVPSTGTNKQLVLRAVAEGVSTQVTDVIERYFQDTRKNELPDEFQALRALPELFASLSQADGSADYQAQIETLKEKIKELEAGLKIAQSKSVSGTFSKAFLEQAGKSLGDWKMWGALGGATFMFVGAPAQSGTTGIMVSVSNIMSSVRGIFP